MYVLVVVLSVDNKQTVASRRERKIKSASKCVNVVDDEKKSGKLMCVGAVSRLITWTK